MGKEVPCLSMMNCLQMLQKKGPNWNSAWDWYEKPKAKTKAMNLILNYHSAGFQVPSQFGAK
eukprot:JP444607.1.p2 GENE.JP444607.1~~JP444607.1.p2  ORF type:complete len:62 (+),score=4.44 JP444607.1:1-186(+)